MRLRARRRGLHKSYHHAATRCSWVAAPAPRAPLVGYSRRRRRPSLQGDARRKIERIGTYSEREQIRIIGLQVLDVVNPLAEQEMVSPADIGFEVLAIRLGQVAEIRSVRDLIGEMENRPEKLGE